MVIKTISFCFLPGGLPEPRGGGHALSCFSRANPVALASRSCLVSFPEPLDTRSQTTNNTTSPPTISGPSQRVRPTFFRVVLSLTTAPSRAAPAKPGMPAGTYVLPIDTAYSTRRAVVGSAHLHHLQLPWKTGTDIRRLAVSPLSPLRRNN